MRTLPSPPPLAAIHTALRIAHQQWMTSFQQGNAPGMAALYAEGGQLLPAHSAAISGRAAIQAFWQGCMDMGLCVMQRHAMEVNQWNETAHEIGAYELYARNKKLLDAGKYVVIWKWAQGRWQIYLDIWSSNLPAI